ncbi:MAG: 5'-methylthioadenosine nucleosidase [Planctomyces sp.]|nr:5'-methylthioadenosine nucleosidase [Planctomyces sp.]
MSAPKQTPSDPRSDAAHADVGIVCALPIELAGFLNRCEHVRRYTGGPFVFRGGRLNGVRVAIVETGPGLSLAERGTLALLDAHSPDWVISAGFSGALVPELQRGDIVVADRVRDWQARELAFDLTYPAEPERGIHCGRLLTMDRIVRTIEEKQRLAGETGCLAVDMESFAVADVCRRQGRRFLAIRSISDDLTEDLPPEAIAIFATRGVRRLGAVAGSLWKRPRSASDLWRLREHAQGAADSLAAFLPPLLMQLVPESAAAPAPKPR